MIKYRGSSLIRAGIIGVLVIVLVIAVGLQPQKLWSWATTIRYQAQFAEAGGLVVGNEVRMSGLKVGSVDEVSLQNSTVIVTFALDGRVRLGSETTAHIRTGTLLGQRVLTVESVGDGRMHARDLIPISRTSSPYSLTDAISDLTTNTADTDTESINQSLDALTATMDQIAPQLGPTFDGFSRLSRALNGRNDTLRDLLSSAAKVSGVLGERSQKLNTLILNANDLVGTLDVRREAIVDLLGSTSAVARELAGLVADNETELASALEKINSVSAMLEKNRDNIAQALPGLAKYQITQGETVANGYYYNAYQPNLSPAQLLQPFLDYAFGFRRGVNAGQPPDNAGPRAEFPFPYNGIPGGSR